MRRARCYVCVLKLSRGIILVIIVMNRDRSMSNKSGETGRLCSLSESLSTSRFCTFINFTKLARNALGPWHDSRTARDPSTNLTGSSEGPILLAKNNSGSGNGDAFKGLPAWFVHSSSGLTCLTKKDRDLNG